MSTTLSTASRPARAGLVVTLVAILMSLLAAQPASAAVAQQRSGSTGSITLNGALTTGYDQMVYNGTNYGGSYVLKRFSTAGFSAARTTAYSGTQRVMAAYLLQRYANGGWQTVKQSSVYYGNVSGTGRLRFPAVTFDAPTYLGQFAYRIAIAVTWTKASNGAVLGGERVVPNRTAENVCSARFTRCTSYYDGVVM